MFEGLKKLLRKMNIEKDVEESDQPDKEYDASQALLEEKRQNTEEELQQKKQREEQKRRFFQNN
jgi:hypothetical protein